MNKPYRRSLRVPPFFCTRSGEPDSFSRQTLKMRKMYIESDIKSIKYDKNA